MHIFPIYFSIVLLICVILFNSIQLKLNWKDILFFSILCMLMFCGGCGCIYAIQFYWKFYKKVCHSIVYIHYLKWKDGTTKCMDKIVCHCNWNVQRKGCCTTGIIKKNCRYAFDHCLLHSIGKSSSFFFVYHILSILVSAYFFYVDRYIFI